MTNKIGTPLYMAPELFSDDHYGLSVDVYAFAMLAFEIFTEQVPFSEKGKSLSLSNLVKKVFSGEKPTFNEFANEKMQNLISQCWSNDPKERPTFDDIYRQLSEDFSYFDEDVDEDEVRQYVDALNDSNNEQKDEKEEKIKQLESENELLKQKIIKMEEENKKLTQIKMTETNDVSADNIDKYKKLENVLNDPEFFEELLNFCQMKLVEEYPLFYRDAKKYKQITDKAERIQCFIDMREKYVCDNARFHVNVSPSILKKIINMDENDPPPDAFNEMLTKIDYLLAVEIFPPFKRSPNFKRILEKKKNGIKMYSAADVMKLLEKNKELTEEIEKLKSKKTKK